MKVVQKIRKKTFLFSKKSIAYISVFCLVISCKNEVVETEEKALEVTLESIILRNYDASEKKYSEALPYFEYIISAKNNSDHLIHFIQNTQEPKILFNNDFFYFKKKSSVSEEIKIQPKSVKKINLIFEEYLVGGSLNGILNNYKNLLDKSSICYSYTLDEKTLNDTLYNASPDTLIMYINDIPVSENDTILMNRKTPPPEVPKNLKRF